MESSENRSKARSRTRKVFYALGLWLAFGLTMRLILGVLAAEPANEQFQRTWSRTDQPVASGLVDRTWMWGPEGFTMAMTEPYAEAPGGERQVQYFDKSRMEDNSYRAAEAPWDVTNGLLVVELVSGQLQLGDAGFEQHQSAQGNVAGDQDALDSPSYQTMGLVRDAAPLPDNAPITWRLDRDGTVTDDTALAQYGVTAAHRVTVPGIDHQVASPFWGFMTSSGMVYENGGHLNANLFLDPFYATGYPITEAYWAEVKVAGTYQDVLLQCFERRCLTYTPGNGEGWQVEAGNVGQHYYSWRYEQIPAEHDGPADPTEEVPVEGTPPAEGTATATEETPDATPTEELPDDEPTPPGTDDEPATKYRYAGSWGETVDTALSFSHLTGNSVSPDGYLYLADTNVVHKYTTEGLYLDTWGDGTGAFDYLRQLSVDGAGNVWIADSGSDKVLKYSPDGQFLDQISGFGAGSDQYTGPYDVAVDGSGYVYVTDDADDLVRKFDSNGTLVDTWGDDASEPQFLNPAGITVDADGNIYMVDASGDNLYVFDPAGMVLRIWGDATDPNLFETPEDVAVTVSGIVYVVDEQEPAILKFNTDGDYLGSWGDIGSGLGELDSPRGIAVDSEGSVYVADEDLVRVYDGDGRYLNWWDGALLGRLGTSTTGMALDSDGNVFLQDGNYDRIQKFDDDGDFLKEFKFLDTYNRFGDYDDMVFGDDGYLYVIDSRNQQLLQVESPGSQPTQWQAGSVATATGIARDDQGNLYISDIDASGVHRFTSSGTYLGTWQDSRFGSLRDVTSHGDRVYVVDEANNCIHLLSSTGVYLDGWGAPGEEDGQFTGPTGIAVDSDGYVYVADTGNQRIQKLSPDGEFLTVIGVDEDGQNQLTSPWRVEVGGDGTVYVLDTGSNQVRMFEPES